MEKLNQWIVLIMGILLILPLIGVSQLGDITTGVSAWLIALGILIIAIVPFFKK